MERGQHDSSDLQPLVSSGPASPPPSLARDIGATAVSLSSIGVLAKAWFAGLLSAAPWWVPLVGLVICGLPAGLQVRLLAQLMPALRRRKE